MIVWDFLWTLVMFEFVVNFSNDPGIHGKFHWLFSYFSTPTKRKREATSKWIISIENWTCLPIKFFILTTNMNNHSKGKQKKIKCLIRIAKFSITIPWSTILWQLINMSHLIGNWKKKSFYPLHKTCKHINREEQLRVK